MPKKPPTGGEKPSRKSRLSKAVSSSVAPNPVTGQSALSSPHLATGGLPSHGANDREQPPSPSAQAVKTRDDDQRSHGASVAVTEPTLRSPHEKSALANHRIEPEPKAGYEKTKEAQKGSDNSPSVSREPQARKAAAQVQDSPHPVFDSAAEQDKRNVADPVNPRAPTARSQGEAAGVLAMPHRQIKAHDSSTSTASPPLLTPGSSAATSPGLRSEGIPSQGGEVVRPQRLTQDKDARFHAAPATSAATSAAVSPSLSLQSDGKAKTQTAAWNASPPANRAIAKAAVMVMLVCLGSVLYVVALM